jgi:cytochrome c553
MKFSSLFLIGAMGVLSAGCSSIEHSRNLANPNVSAHTIAQQVCSLCHGIDGNSVSPTFPRLARQTPEYLVTQLENFRGHHRSDPAGYEFMWGLTQYLTDEQIKGLAEYFSKQVPVANAMVSAEEVAAGKLIFDNGIPEKLAPPCGTCHGPNAQGLGPFPRIGGQHQDYLVKQLHVFQETEQRPGTPMEQVTHLLSRQEIEAVAGYLQSLPVTQ